MNKYHQLLISITLITTTTLVHAARLEDVIDVPKPDITETTSQHYDASRTAVNKMKVDRQRLNTDKGESLPGVGKIFDGKRQVMPPVSFPDDPPFGF